MLRDLGDLRAAERALQQLLANPPQRYFASVDPELKTVRTKGLLAELHRRQGRLLRVSNALGPRVLLSHVLLEEGQDWPAAEAALRQVLALAPKHQEAKRNLELLRRRHCCSTNENRQLD